MNFLKRRKQQRDPAGFLNTGITTETVLENELTHVRLQGQTVLLTRAAGELVAFSNICPHAAADLSKGRLSRGQIKCPDHGYTFDVRTGRATWPEDEVCRLKRFALKEEAGLIWVQLT